MLNDRKPTIPGRTHGIVGMWNDDRGRTVVEVQCDDCGRLETTAPIHLTTVFYRCAQRAGAHRICAACHEASGCSQGEECAW